MANGTYKDVKKLRVGDHTATLNRIPNVVKHIRSRRLRTGEDIVSIKHDAWHKVIGTSGELHVLTINNDGSPDWLQASTLVDYQTRVFALPSKGIYSNTQDNAATPTTTPDKIISFSTGFVSGAFMRIGALRKYPEVTFVFDSSSKVGDMIAAHSLTAFGAVGVKSGVGHVRRLTFYDKSMWATFFSMGAFDNRCLPHIDNINIASFASGLNTGIVASGYVGLPPLGESLRETLYWSALQSDKPLCYGQHIYMHNKTPLNGCYGRAIVVEQCVQATLWDVCVEPLITNHDTQSLPSLIVNNLVFTAANAWYP